VVLVTGLVILAVIDAITELRLWYAPVVGTSELSVSTAGIFAVHFVRPVATVVLMITDPGLEDAATVTTPEL